MRPIKVVLTNYPEGQTEELTAVNNPEEPAAGTRSIKFSREIYIENDDFMENPPPKYFRLRPGGEVRLKYGYIIRCEEVIKDSAGEILELRCTADLESKSGGATANRKIKGTIHWVNVGGFDRSGGPPLRPAFHRTGTRSDQRLQIFFESALARNRPGPL